MTNLHIVEAHSAAGARTPSPADALRILAVDAAIGAAHASTDRPTLICCKTVIGRGSPNKTGSHDVHGAALGEKEVAATREQLGWRHPPFDIPGWVYAEWDARARGQVLETAWRVKFSAYAARHPALAVEFHCRMARELPAGWGSEMEKLLRDIAAKAENIATHGGLIPFGGTQPAPATELAKV